MKMHDFSRTGWFAFPGVRSAARSRGRSSPRNGKAPALRTRLRLHFGRSGIGLVIGGEPPSSHEYQTFQEQATQNPLFRPRPAVRPVAPLATGPKGAEESKTTP